MLGVAAAFDEDDVSPVAVVLAEAFSCSDGAESVGVVQCEAGVVLGEDSCFDGPHSCGFWSSR